MYQKYWTCVTPFITLFVMSILFIRANLPSVKKSDSFTYNNMLPFGLGGLIIGGTN